MTTGQRIKATRKATGLTQKELGEKLGITYQTLAQWENDLRNPKYDTLQRIASALGVSVLDLLGENTPENRELLEQEARRTGKSVAEVERETAEDILDQESTERLIAALESADHSVVQSFSGIPDDDIMVHLNSIIADELTRSGRILTLKRAYELSLKPGYGRFPVRSAPESMQAPQEGKDTTPLADAPETASEGE